jgi:hypothetical protein
MFNADVMTHLRFNFHSGPNSHPVSTAAMPTPLPGGVLCGVAKGATRSDSRKDFD